MSDGRYWTFAVAAAALAVVGCAASPETSEDETRPTQRERSISHAESETFPVKSSPVTGEPESPLTVTMWIGPLDPEAREMFRRLHRAKNEFTRSEMRFVYHLVPAEHRVGSSFVARALVYADRQGAFIEAFRRMLERQPELYRAAATEGVREVVRSEFAELGLELPEESWPEEVRRTVERDRSLADSLSIQRTPTVYVNGKKIEWTSEVGQIVEMFRRTRTELYEMRVRRGLARREVYRASIEARYEQPDRSSYHRTVRYVPLFDEDPVRGATEATPVTAVVFVRYANPHTAPLEAMMSRLLEEYPGTLRYVVKPLPNPDAKSVAARLALAAAHADAFGPVHRALVDRRDPPADEEAARKLLEGLDVDAEAVMRAYRSRDVSHHLRILTRTGGVGRTPKLFVNGLSFDRIPPYPELRRVIREQSELDLGDGVRDESATDPYRAAVEHNKREHQQ